MQTDTQNEPDAAGVAAPEHAASPSRPGLLERAYALAREGKCANPREIEVLLTREGYLDVGAQLSGPTVRKALRQLCAAAARP